MAYNYSPEVQGFLGTWQPQTYAWSNAGDSAWNQANAQINQAANRESQRRDIEWANSQRMTDPMYWAQAFGFNGGGSIAATPNKYEQRLNSLLDNPDSIQNTGAYKFAFNQGQEAVNRNLAAKGLLKSGNRLSELTKFGQGLASQQYGAEADRLSRLYGIGAQMDIEREKANNQMRLAMMNNAMQMQKRYMPPGTFQTAAGIMNRWD